MIYFLTGPPTPKIWKSHPDGGKFGCT
jgi:hypothetical protein